MIGMVLVWKLKDTYKAIFEIDTQTMAEGSTGQAGIGASAAQIMNMLGRFVQIQDRCRSPSGSRTVCLR